jgi:hypothetical protein
VGALLLAAAGASASGPVAVYALIDKVVMEPNEREPQRLQVWGVFSVAKGEKGYEYESPAYGYMYFSVLPDSADKCRREWVDLGKLAGTDQVVAIGDRTLFKGARVRSRSEKPDKPDLYPLAWGLLRIHSRNPLARQLLSMPIPIAPGDGDQVGAGTVTLRARNIIDRERPKARYLFEVESTTGEKESSGPVEGGKRETTWSPKMKIRSGEKYTWYVRAVEGEWKGPTAVATFRGKSAP